jgi:hypothetical protein
MIYSKQRLKEVAEIKKSAVEKIQTGISEFEPVRRRMYIEEFNDEFQSFETVCEPKAILHQAASADLIWIGDYHALPSSQTYAANFLRKLGAMNSRVAVAVEPVFARNQKALDRWQAEIIPDREFLERIRYEEEWGCEWASYKPIFETARELGMPIYGVDCHPRHDMRSIGRRDLGIARRISRIIENEPARTLVVVFGECHLADRHLPRRVRAILGRKEITRRELLVLQNLDSIYWQLQELGHEDARCVRIKTGQYCVFNATPIEKYESFRQYLHKCVEDDSTGDWGIYIQTLVDVMTEFLGLKGPVVSDYMPKVYSWQEVPPSDVRRFLKSATERTSYIPQLNSLFIDGLHLGSAVEESTRFIHHACRGELQEMADRSHGDQFFVTVIERALGYFCSKLLDSSRDGIEPLADQVLNQIGYDEPLAGAIQLVLNPAKRPRMRHFEALRAAVEAKAGGQRMQPLLAQLLGYALGRRLYQAYLESRISRREIQALFHDPLNTPQRPLECYMELTERLTSSNA